MEDLGFDTLTWEHDLPSVPDAETRVDWALAEAEYATRMINQNTAGLVVAIHTVLCEARMTPSVFVGPHATPDNRDQVEFAVRAAVSDLSVRMSLTENAVLNYERQAVVMMSRTPLAWSAFRFGEVAPANARVVAELAASLPDGHTALFEKFDTAIAELSVALAPPRFRHRARVVREKLLGHTAEERAVEERAFRRVIFEAAPDGMHWTHIYAPADVGTLAQARIDERARELVKNPNETRTMDQLRADIAGELLLGNGSGGSTGDAVGVRVGLLVPVMSLLSHDDQPATLEGYGPIDIETARRLTAKAPSFYRILTHPVTGTILDIDKTTLRIPADMRRWLEIRDETCTFPGCGRRARSCEIDHTTDRQYGGITKITNLAHLCKKHHREKHHTLWKPEHLPDGKIQWTSPTGHRAENDPPPF